jgi:two-component system phosphate regulon response regulator PhoB
MVRVLVIDDEPMVLSTLRVIIQSSGHEVAVAGDGAAALEELGSRPADLVFCELSLPGVGGLEVVRRLRRDHPGVKVVAMSGVGGSRQDELLHRALALGARVALAKPFRLLDVQAAVSTALRSPASPFTGLTPGPL